MNSDTAPHPILKWAGGKTQILQDLTQNCPHEFKSYFEPFIGGGALFFHLWRLSRIRYAVLSDMNKDLVSLYVTVRDRVDELIDELSSGTYRNEKQTYYSIRKQFNSAKLTGDSSVEQAARLIYLNRTCYNGLYRVNSEGAFNVPFGRYRNPQILDEANLRAVSTALKAAKLEYADFEVAVKNASRGDFLYLDPPYQPLSQTSAFTAYTKTGFGLDEQTRLAGVFRNLSSRGCYVLESNSATEEIRTMYSDFRVIEVYAIRAISSDGSTRGRIPELLISNYEPGHVQTGIESYV